MNSPNAPGSVGLVETKIISLPEPLKLECGETLPGLTLAYETYGCLDAEKKNAVLVCHALSGTAHAAGWHAGAEQPGWWDSFIGPGKAIDTNRYFVISSNLLGGCGGSSGPTSPNPVTGKPWGAAFPVVTVGDMVEAQCRLLDHLGVQNLLSVIGGSLGGMQALEWALRFPDRVSSSVVLAATARVSTQNIAFNAVGRNAVLADPNWKSGDYYGSLPPSDGLATARMIGHITYLSQELMHHKFGRRLQSREHFAYDFSKEFQVESYLGHQGENFVERFDANSYLYMTKAMDYFDPAQQWGGGDMAEACRRVQGRVLVLSFSSDWLFPPAESWALVQSLLQARTDVSYLNLKSSLGHDAFLLEQKALFEPLSRFFGAVLKGKAEGSVTALREDQARIAKWVQPGSRVLDLGCGDGDLLQWLRHHKQVSGQGVEKSEARILACLAKGVPVVQADLDQPLDSFEDKSFDEVLLSFTIQQLRQPGKMIDSMLKIGTRGIVSFPNFGHVGARLRLLVTGRMPKNYSWQAASDLQLLCLGDFKDSCRFLGIRILKQAHWFAGAYRDRLWGANLLSESCILQLE